MLGSRDTTELKGAHGHTDHTDEPHNHPNSPNGTHAYTKMHPYDRATTESAADCATTESAADSTAASPTLPRSRPLPAADSEEAAPCKPDPAATRSQSASPRLLKGGRRNEGARCRRVAAGGAAGAPYELETRAEAESGRESGVQSARYV